MYESLFKYIKTYSNTVLTTEEEEYVKAAFKPKKLRKRQYFLQSGDVCKYFAFIVNGAMRQYSVDEKGAEHIVQLAVENWWVGDRESYLMLSPSSYNIDAWEDCDLLVIAKADFLALSEKVPALVLMARQMDDKNSIAMQRRLNATISFSAEKRYTDFVQRYPAMLQRFPLHLLASYLGITKETLSRIRKQILKP